MKKKCFICVILAVLMTMSLLPNVAFAEETNKIDAYIDATQFTKEELSSIIDNAWAEELTIVIDWQDGMVVHVYPDNEPEPRINVTKTIMLTKNEWTAFDACNPLPLIGSHLKVTNDRRSPGKIDIKLINDAYVGPAEKIFEGLNPGQTAEMYFYDYYAIYLKATQISGSYTVKASDWII